MGLFDKKTCDLCGEKIGLFGGLELEIGNLCSDCADKISPLLDPNDFEDLDSLREHLAYREENRPAAEEFHATQEIGQDMTLMVDEEAGTFVLTETGDASDADVFSLEDVVECSMEVEEEENEIFDVDDEGNDVSYDPPRFEYAFTFWMQIVLDHPQFDELNFPLNDSPLELDTTDEDLWDGDVFDPERDAEYQEYLDMADQIMIALTGEAGEYVDGEEEEPEEEPAEMPADDGFVTCPYCSSRMKRPDSGRCPYCGGFIEF